jgi:glycerate 2-kinase|tara:strand:- start:366 stop:1577 length:1212 start_codon:yes stop_codon:yes gene_type:complete
MFHPYYDQALKAFLSGVAAADPAVAVCKALPSFDQAPTLIAVGKAAVSMARAAQSVLGDLPEVLVVTNPENASDLPGAQVFAAAHPIPDQIGLKAGQTVIAALQRASAAQRPVLCLISGGGSALLPAPIVGISLQDKIDLNALLLASGANIEVMNLIRQQLSLLKGGGMLSYASPSPVTSLILSDVIGDDLRVVASGLTVSPIGTRLQACSELKALGLWGQTNAAVKTALERPEEIIDLPVTKNILIGSNVLSLAAMGKEIPEATIHKMPLVGDVSQAAARVAAAGPGIHLFGGETTVRLTGTGRGGRNQELALRVALLAEYQNWQGRWLYLQAGTDGRDGPTDAAGGVVCEASVSVMSSVGIDPNQLLANNDAYSALQAAKALLITGGTGTNVADLGVLIRA